MNRSRRIRASVAALLILSTGCIAQGANEEADAPTTAPAPAHGWFGFTPRLAIPPGTTMDIRLTSGISSETASRGDSWNGVVVSPVIVGNRVAIPAGSPVSGRVTVAQAAERGTRAELGLDLRTVWVDANSYRVRAQTEPVIAGSPRARNLGAIAGGTAAGALIGKAVGGDGHDALVGGLLGGAAAGGAVAASRGYQVRLRSGTVLKFSTSQEVALR